jgi:DNA-binding response OmpR family regulator
MNIESLFQKSIFMQNPNSAKKHQILFVDDDADDRDIINEVFCRFQWQEHIHICKDAESLFWHLSSLSSDLLPSLIVLDTQLPKQGGESIIKMLKFQDRYKHIPVIMLTSSLTERKKNLFTLLGATDSLQKPDTLKGYETIMHQLRQYIGTSQEAGKEFSDSLT